MTVSHKQSVQNKFFFKKKSNPDLGIPERRTLRFQYILIYVYHGAELVFKTIQTLTLLFSHEEQCGSKISKYTFITIIDPFVQAVLPTMSPKIRMNQFPSTSVALQLQHMLNSRN